MSRGVVFHQIHITIRIPRELPEDRSEGVRGTLTGEDFMNHLRRAVRSTVRLHPELAIVRVSIGR